MSRMIPKRDGASAPEWHAGRDPVNPPIMLTEAQLIHVTDLVIARILDRFAVPGSATASSHEEDSMRSLMTAEEVAEKLRMTTAWVYEQTRLGLLPAVKLGRYYRYRREAIDRLIAVLEANG